MRFSNFVTTATIFLASIPASGAPVNYVLDDGTSEFTGYYGGFESVFRLNAFQVQPGGETITEVSVAFGSPSVDPIVDGGLDGGPVRLYLWDDPTNDGNPEDAQVLTSFDGVIESSRTDTFISFTLPTAVGVGTVGDWFFVGTETFFDPDLAVGRDICCFNQAWYAAFVGPANPNDLGSAGVFYGSYYSSWLIRATGVTAVPEPGSVALLGGGVLLVMLRRRTRSAR